jgi:hypothetical protein
VKVVCSKCCTSGEIEASFGVDDIVNPTLRFDLRGVSAFMEIDLVANGGHTFTLPLFRSPPSPLGFSIPGGPSLGLNFQLDLIFSFAATIDLTGGFFFQMPQDSFFEASLVNGALGDLGFDGARTQALPLIVNNGNSSAKFQVDLQLRAEVGIDATASIIPAFDGFGAQAAVGVFVNLVEFVTELTTTETCALQASEVFDINVGAFLQADVQVGGKTIGAVPTVSTTLFEFDIGTQCLVSGGLPFPTRTEGLATATPECVATAPAFGNFSGFATLGTGRGAYPAPTTISRDAAIGLFTPTALLTLTTPAAGVFRRTNHSSTAVALPPGATTTVLTLTSCAAAIPNCPESLASVIEVTRTVCAATTSKAATAVCGLPPINVTSLSSLITPVVSTLDPAKISQATETATTTTFVNPTALAGPGVELGGGGFFNNGSGPPGSFSGFASGPTPGAGGNGVGGNGAGGNGAGNGAGTPLGTPASETAPASTAAAGRIEVAGALLAVVAGIAIWVL